MKVTMDGESHGIMTLAAASAGMVMAFIILGVLMLLLLYRRKENEVNTDVLEKSETSNPTNNIPELSSISIIGNDNQGFVLNEANEKQRKRNAF